VKSLGDSRAFDDLIEMAVRNPDEETRRLAAIQLLKLEGDGSVEAMFKLYNKSSDPDIKAMVIDTLWWISEIEPLTKIALSEPSPEFRLRALWKIKSLKENSDSEEVKAWDVSALQDQLNELSQDEPPPPPPPPPPPSSLDMTVESDKELTPLRWHRDSDSVFVMLREIAYASMRRDAKFFERVLDDDYVGVGPDGATRNKAEEIAELNRLDSIKKFEFEDLRVSGNDDVAFATFLATVHFQNNGQDSTEQYRYTVNFIKKDVPIDVNGEVELFKHSEGAQLSCSKCHSEKGLLKMPLVMVMGKEKGKENHAMMIAKPVADERIPVDALLHQRQLKIAAIHMSRKQ
ncbi:MAG TPA: DUF4440 domain-containing protein, partial [Blastocatellia bacterium]|nr:DUF4440 domain-containing protein [Blastocatellia bacterium]